MTLKRREEFLRMIPKLTMNGENRQTLSSKIVYSNPFMRIREDDVIRPNGVRAPYFVLERGQFSIIIPLTKKNEIYLVGQYRYAVDFYSWEFPMGFVEGLKPLAIARQELKEETGLIAKKWDLLGKFHVAPGHSSQKAYVFVAQDLVEGEKEPEENEFLEVKKVSLNQVGEMIKKGKILDGPTIVAYHFLLGEVFIA